MPDRPHVPEEAVEALAKAIYAEPLNDPRRKIARRGLEAAAPALRKQGAEEEKRQRREKIEQLGWVNDEQVAARRGPMHEWLRRDQVLAALDQEADRG